ncbi:hypothetical protein B0H13DRAFT_2307367 [Mycena leptocephala]|nr:hypothetical protein B0H13DRAFT_2307367 [Mycena leptocephala]
MSGIFSGRDDPGSTVDPVPIVVFDTMAAVSSISLALTLAPAVLSPNVHRSKAWFSMITTMMIFPLLYLLNVGSQFNYHDSPPIGLCILQTGFIYAGPPTCTISVLCFITDMAFELRAMLFNGTRNKIFMSLLILLPSILFICVFFEAFALVADNGGVHFNATHMYCDSERKAPLTTSAALVVILLFLTLCVEVWTIVMLYRNWAAVRSFRHTTLQLGVIIRLGVFSLVVGFGAVMGGVALPNDSRGGALWNIFIVSVPLLAALAFGTRRKDIMSAYAFWNWKKNGFQIQSQSSAV